MCVGSLHLVRSLHMMPMPDADDGLHCCMCACVPRFSTDGDGRENGWFLVSPTAQVLTFEMQTMNIGGAIIIKMV